MAFALLWAPLPAHLAGGERAGEASRKPDHWAFQPLSSPQPPPARDGARVRNPIDRFVLARLEAEGLAPSPAADRAALIRRLSLDLTGLPPAVEEVDRFLADASPDATEQLIERLLASPRYGERWARWWLDGARYADTNGYEKDVPRVMWRYRDWVIDALNRDLPFDCFAIEQIAGDLLPGAGLSERIATGFHRNTLINDEGGADQEQFRYESIVDRTNTTATVFLGLTLACAQCHDHKYDPISQEEYFRFFAFFNSADEPTIEAPTAAEAERRHAHRAEIARLEEELFRDSAPGREEFYAGIDARQEAWEAAAAGKSARWTVLDPLSAASDGGAVFTRLPDRSLLAGGPSPNSDTYRIRFGGGAGAAGQNAAGITAFRLEVLPHPSLPAGGPGRGRILGDGNFVLSEFSVSVEMPEAGSGAAPARPVALRNASADYSQEKFEIAKAIDGDIESGWSIGAGKPGMNIARTAVFETAERIPPGAALTITLVQYYTHEHTIGRLRIAATADEPPVRASGLPAEVEEALLVPAADRTAEQRAAIRGAYRREAPELKEVQERIAALRRSEPKVTTALVMEERAKPRETRLRLRGEFLNEGKTVEPGVPACLPPLPEGSPRNRLGLARWLVDPGNPLTARVAVNRIWRQLFGRGLVSTLEDFGTRGDPPSHPELLDWLAGEFIRRNWSLKATLRLITGSATYRQSARASPELLERDPDNRLLARGPRFRMEAEAIRDIALAASGLLSGKIGGPSVFPPQPDGVLGLSYGSFDWKTAAGEDRYRRGLYTFWKRANPYPGFITFDAPPGTTACAGRIRTNTPLQALTLLNDAVFVEAARALALRALREEPTDAAGRARLAFRLCAARQPEPEEVKEMTAFVERQLQRYRAGAADPAPLAGKAEAGIDPRELAAWTLLARALLNLDETVTKE